jgi:hypothetical protein
MLLKISGIDFVDFMVGVNCKLIVLVKVDSRWRGNDYSRDSRWRGNDYSRDSRWRENDCPGDSRWRGISYTPPSPSRGEEFAVRIQYG